MRYNAPHITAKTYMNLNKLKSDNMLVINFVKDTLKSLLAPHLLFFPQSTETPEECKENADIQPDADGAPAVEEDNVHSHHHGHHHGHGHGHGQHGDHQGFPPHGVSHGHDHNHGHHHGNHDGVNLGHGHGHGQSQQGVEQQGYEQDSGVSQRQQHLDFGQMQQAAQIHHMPQEAQGVSEMQRP